MSSGAEIRHYARAVARRWWLVLLLMVVAAGFMYQRTVKQRPVYSGSAILMVTTQSLLTTPTSIATQNPNQGGGGKAEISVTNSIIQLLTSRAIAERVASALDIDDPETVQRSLRANKVSSSNLISVRATSRDRELAPKIANEAAAQFIDYFRETNRRDAADVRRFIEQQLAQTRSQLETLDDRIAAFKANAGMTGLETAMTQAAQQLATTQADQEATRLRLEEDEAKLRSAFARLSREKYTRVTIQDLENNPVYAQIETSLTDLQIQMLRAEQRYTGENPKLQLLQTEIAALRKQLAAHTRRILGKQQMQVNPVYDQLMQDIVQLQIDRTAAAARLNALKFSARQRVSSVGAIPAKERALTTLLRERDIRQGNYAFLSERYMEALLRESESGYVPAGLHIMERAIPASRPVKTNVPARVGIAALVGLAIGVFASVVIENSQDGFRSAQDAERVLGAPVLAQVPDMTLRRPRPVPVIPVLIAALLLIAITLGVGAGSGRLKVTMLPAAFERIVLFQAQPERLP